MPIESFYEMLVIDTPEKARKLVEAFEAAEQRGPYVPKHDVMKELEEDERIMKEILEKRRSEKNKESSQ
ncbi:MAG: hypothetical protein FWH45_02775 [Methanomassiliicoccaceae archaeon]|nr:hypothetical protein [Methanomassiliicoccaceae archaeon]MCL2146083.1 hypothetical protein [Methanomassiliicoccaceae archaeon]